MIFSFILFLGLFAVIGLSSALKSRGTKSDYYLASRSIPPALVGLSAVATNNSGYMFIGVIGYTYSTGLASIWLMIGWILGDFLAASLVHSRLRHQTEHTGEVSFAGVVGSWPLLLVALSQSILAPLASLVLLSFTVPLTSRSTPGTPSSAAFVTLACTPV